MFISLSLSLSRSRSRSRFQKSQKSRKSQKSVMFLAGDFNINLPDFDASKTVQNLVNLMFRNGIILPTQLTT